MHILCKFVYITVANHIVSVFQYLEPLFVSLITGEDYEAPELEDLLETSIMTFITTGVMDAPFTVTGDVRTQNNYKRTGGDVIAAGNTAALKKLGTDSDTRSIQKLAGKIKDDPTGKRQSALVGQLYNQLLDLEKEGNATADRLDISQRLQETGYSPEQARVLAEALVARHTGQELTRDQKKLLKEHGGDDAVTDIVKQLWYEGKGNLGQDTTVQSLRNTAKRAAVTPAGDGSPVPTAEPTVAPPSDPTDTAPEVTEAPTTDVSVADASGATPSPMSVYESTLALGTNAPADPVAAATDAFTQNGTVTNKQIQDILNSTAALDYLRQQTGIPIKGTIEERSDAVRQAIAQLAQQSTVDTTAQTDYDNVTNQGGIENGDTQERKEYPGGVQRDTQGDFSGDVAQSPRDRGIYASSSTQSGGISSGDSGILHFTDSEGRSISQEDSNKLHGTAITDDNGAPLAVYHVTDNTEFTSFEVGDTGFHFGSAKQAETHKQKRNYKSGRTFRVYLNVKNPYQARLDIMGWTPRATAMYLWSDGILTDAEHQEIKTLWKNGDGYNSPSAVRLREIIESKGYDGIVYPNAFEGDGPSYMAFHDDQIIKSEITPFGENTNVPSPTDSVGAAPSGFDPNTHLQYKYGTLPEGENPVRSDDLPVSTDGTDRVSLTARTVKGAKVTPDEFVDLLNKDTAKGGMSYIPITNDDTVQNAIAHITEEGWDESLRNWTADVRAGKAGADCPLTHVAIFFNASARPRYALSLLDPCSITRARSASVLSR